jgi:hypothetical protein
MTKLMKTFRRTAQVQLTLARVIDVLGLQMMDDATMQTEHSDIGQNPAYRNLKGSKIVEGAIEHMAVIHCHLNGSVIQVGKVARQFVEVSEGSELRRQVRDIMIRSVQLRIPTKP